MKKLVSMFLVFIILIAQFGTIIAASYVTGGPETQTLEEYLIENGVDEDENGELSDEEWANVKNLYELVDLDITNIEKAVNLKSLSLDNCNINNINLSQLTSLENLSLTGYDLTNVDLSELINLKSMYIYNCSLNNADFSKLNNLESLTIWESDLTNVNFSSLKKLKDLAFMSCNLTGVDFSGLTKLKELSIYYEGVLLSEGLPEQNLNLSSLPQLESLTVDATNIERNLMKKIDTSKSTSLKSLVFMRYIRL